MYLSFISYFKDDKSIQHPILGEITCSTLKEGHKNCKEYVSVKDKQHLSHCKIFYELIIALQCYKSEKSQDFYDYLNERIEERVKLIKFLHKNQSKIPEFQEQYMQSTFNLFGQVDQDVMEQEYKLQEIIKQQQQDNKKYL